MKRVIGFIKLVPLYFVVYLFMAFTDSNANSFQHNSYLPINNYSDTLSNPELTLKGTVKNQQGQPLKNVKIASGNTQVSSTDSAGIFNLTIENKPTILTFSLDKMVTVKRSYHPAMQEQYFKIIMEKDSCKYCAKISDAIRNKN